MAKLNLTTQAAPAPAVARAVAQVWLNVGRMQMIDGVEEFISFKVGIPLDTLADQPIRGKDPHFRKICAAKNALRDETLKAVNESFEPGESAFVEGLITEIHRVAEYDDSADEETTVETPAVSRLSFAKRA